MRDFFKFWMPRLPAVAIAVFAGWKAYPIFRLSYLAYLKLPLLDKVCLIIVLLSVILKPVTKIVIFGMGRHVERQYRDGSNKKLCKYMCESENHAFQCISPFYKKRSFDANKGICHAKKCNGYRPDGVDGEALVCAAIPLFPLWGIFLDFTHDVAIAVEIIRTLMRSA